MFTPLIAVSLYLYIRYISYEHKFIGKVSSEKVTFENCRNSFNVFLFSIENSISFSRTPSWWGINGIFFDIQPKAVVVFCFNEFKFQTFLKCHLLQSFALGILCPGGRVLEHKDKCVPWTGKWTSVDIYAQEEDWERFKELKYIDKQYLKNSLYKNYWWAHALKKQIVITNLTLKIIFPKQEGIV